MGKDLTKTVYNTNDVPRKKHCLTFNFVKEMARCSETVRFGRNSDLFLFIIFKVK